MVLSKLLAIICILASTVFNSHAFSEHDEDAFLESFFRHYECSPEGRYTHEYHSFLLDWTSQSFDQLEQRLLASGLSLDGRMVIMGYEESAVHRYYTDYSKSTIDDEAARQNRSGWSQKLHNRFGFMSGFLFKNLNDTHDLFHHIDANLIPIFDDRAEIFQKHAFGGALPLMRVGNSMVDEYIKKGDDKRVFALLERFWTALYDNNFTVGNTQFAGTQDILFSIQYMKHLMRSKLPLKQFYTGPDITYPIEISCKQDKTATVHAQHFVKKLTRKLQPINDEPTVYVFCSFVDGVGKSTMLGNVKNWICHGDNVNQYGHVDNSSSQFAEIFKFSDKTFIADLPAQVSHFTYKPDGYVFVDMQAQDSPHDLKKVEQFVRENKLKLIEAFATRKQVCASHDNSAQHPLDAFIANLRLLKKEHTTDWVGFEFEGKPYLFKNVKNLEFRSYQPIATVRSEGLKNIDAEQMIFSLGVRMPLTFDIFMDDLTKRLHEQGIKHVVFVDFISMYPRSSRENIRINYVLQQLALLDQSFDIQHSWYRDFVAGGGELLYLLKNNETRLPMMSSLKAEGLLRLILFKRLISQHNTSLAGIPLTQLTHELKNEWMRLVNKQKVDALVHDKVAHQMKSLESQYGLSKSYINVQCASLTDVVRFSGYLSDYMETVCGDEFMKLLWAPTGVPNHTYTETVDGKKVNLAATDAGQIVYNRTSLDLESKNQSSLEQLIRPARACWGYTIKSLLLMGQGEPVEHSLRVMPNQLIMVPYSVVSKNGQAYGTQLFSKPSKKKVPGYFYDQISCLEIQSIQPETFTHLGGDDGLMVRLSCDVASSARGMLGYGVTESTSSDDSYDLLTTGWILKKHHARVGNLQVMTTSQLWEALENDPWWKHDKHQKLSQARKNGSFDNFKKQLERINTVDPAKNFLPITKVYLGDERYVPIAREVVRLLATLDLMVKEPNAHVAIRHDEPDDYIAALKLIENVVLPEYCNIIFPYPLFDDYSAVLPLQPLNKGL